MPWGYFDQRAVQTWGILGVERGLVCLPSNGENDRPGKRGAGHVGRMHYTPTPAVWAEG